MTTPTTHQRLDVGAYVAAVRAHLDDLEPGEVEELTEGLESDLADLAAEADDPLAHRLGPPQAYADELRASAGLRPRGPGRRSRPAVLEQLRQHPRWPAVAGFFVVLRPVWWVARALVAFGLIWQVVLGGGVGLVGLAVLAVMVVVSVELGRGRWRRQTWLVPLVLIGNVVAALALPFLVVAGPSWVRYTTPAYDMSAASPAPPGLVNNGEPVRNVFAYDRDGRPLTDVQLFDDQGRPLAVDPAYAGQDESQAAPQFDAFGRPVWNAFPIRQQRVTFGDNLHGTAPTTAAPTPAPLPVPSVPPLAPTASPTATAPSTATTAPTSTPTQTRNASPTSSPARSS